jgi:hypothetical protein
VELGDFFGPGALVRDRTGDLVSLLRGHRIGRITILSGGLRIGDAHSLEDCAPIDVPAGAHEVVFGANEMDAGHDGIGLSIRVRSGAIVRWKRLRSVGVDSAAVVIADARAKVSHEKLSSIESPLGAAIIGRSTAVARVGSDGRYPLQAGYDARDRLVALAVATRTPRSFARWPARGSDVPPVDARDLDACLAWAREVGGDQAIVRAGETDVAPLRAIRPIPADLRRYYATHTPWIGGNLATFRAIVKRNALGRALPIAVNGDDALVYLDEEDRVVDLCQGSVMGTSLDLRAWALLSTIAVHDLRTRGCMRREIWPHA